MNGIVTPPPGHIAPAPASNDDVVACDAFWPGVSLEAARQTERIGFDVPRPRLLAAVRDAMLDIATELRGWRADREAEGYLALTAVPPRRLVDGVGDYELLWTRAVQSVVAADLGERLIEQTTTPAGHDRAEPVLLQADRHWRNVRMAVRDFLGRPHVDVELI